MELSNSKHTLKDLLTILGYFNIKKDTFQLQSLTSGYINDTFLVSNMQSPLYILQRINHDVFSDTKGLMLNVSTALTSLIDEGYTKIELLPTYTGEKFTQNPEGYWRLMSYIPESTTYDNTEDKKTAFEAGRIIGKFHLLLQDESLTDYVDTIPQFHDLDLRKNQFEEALITAEESKLQTAKNAIAFAKTTLGKLQSIAIEKLNVRICHNDTKLNNILFSKASGEALCLIDLDTIMKGYFFYDFGDAIRTIANTAPEDEQDHNKITFDKELFRAFIKGLSSNASFLSKDELKSLPMGAAFMPFIHGIRALTDYLENNRYYKVSYENQNLDRCLSLFNFSEKALGNITFMEDVIATHFSELQEA